MTRIKILKYPDKKKILEIKYLINKFWKNKNRKKHVLVRRPEVFDWLYKKQNKKYNFYFTNNSNFICNGFLGFLKNSKFSKNLKKTNVIWLSMWLSDSNFRLRKKNSHDYEMTGFYIILKFLKDFKKNVIATIGCNEKTRVIYEKLGFKVGELSHAYFLNPYLKNFKIAKINYRKCQKFKKNFNNFYFKNIDISYLKKTDFEKTNRKIFYKDIDFFLNKYKKNTFYKYDFCALFNNKKLIFFLVTKEIIIKNRKVLRIIDFFGSLNYFKFTATQFLKIFKKFNYEYIDFYCYGLSKKDLNKGGFLINSLNSKNIIPNYFEPYVQSNIKINFAYNPDLTEKIYFFKGDCDQERPN